MADNTSKFPKGSVSNLKPVDHLLLHDSKQITPGMWNKVLEDIIFSHIFKTNDWENTQQINCFENNQTLVVNVTARLYTCFVLLQWFK